MRVLVRAVGGPVVSFVPDLAWLEQLLTAGEAGPFEGDDDFERTLAASAWTTPSAFRGDAALAFDAAAEWQAANLAFSDRRRAGGSSGPSMAPGDAQALLGTLREILALLVMYYGELGGPPSRGRKGGGGGGGGRRGSVDGTPLAQPSAPGVLRDGDRVTGSETSSSVTADRPADATTPVTGSMDEGWATHTMNGAGTGNQAPAGWTARWNPGTEMVHKLSRQLPPDEQRGGPRALIRDGDATYKVFNGGGPVDASLETTLPVPAGGLTLTIPVQTHDHGGGGGAVHVTVDGAPVPVTVNGQTFPDGVVPASVMGDREWRELQVRLDRPGDHALAVRFVSQGAQDFFVDGLTTQ